MLGFVYGLAATGPTLLFGVMRVINFALIRFCRLLEAAGTVILSLLEVARHAPAL